VSVQPVARGRGAVKCWGYNAHGQPGDGTTATNRLVPTDVSGHAPRTVCGLTNVSALTAGGYHTCAILTNGDKQCWGLNFYGQLGNGQISYVPTPGNVSDHSTAYTYADGEHPYAVTDLSSNESYAYDADGNMTSRTEGGSTYTQTFDAENRLISVTVGGQTTSFLYNGDGQMVKKTKPGGNYVLYIGAVMELEKDSNHSVLHITVYYPAGGAVRVDNTLSYVLGDQLGSASTVLDSAGNKTAETRYYPFGETRVSTGSMPTDRLFTGQRAMEDLGIYFYNARFYDPLIGRFLSADTVVPGAGNSQSYDRYAYSLGNPIIYIDPSGHISICSHADGEGGGCESRDTILKTIKPRFGVNISEEMKYGDLYNVYYTLSEISNQVNQRTHVDGDSWIRKYVGGSSVEYGSFEGDFSFEIVPPKNNYVNPFTNTVNLMPGMKPIIIAHEFAHVIDNKTGKGPLPATIAGGGIAETFAPSAWGSPIFFIGGIPNSTPTWTGDTYGNNSVADYFAHTFAYSMFRPDYEGMPAGAKADMNQWLLLTSYTMK
jgi:RHS repeat-associated protein